MDGSGRGRSSSRPSGSEGVWISPDSAIRTIVIFVGLLMIGIGWYKKAKCDKKVFNSMEDNEKLKSN